MRKRFLTTIALAGVSSASPDGVFNELAWQQHEFNERGT